MVSINEFDILNYIFKYKTFEKENFLKNNERLFDVDLTVTGLVNQLFLDNKLNLTEKAYLELDNYKVDNAVIMAAGMSSRFAPLSYENPKALLDVKGEKLIERQIRQLQEVGINDIVVVVGYMKEKLFYLEEKFNVKIVINEDYYKFNNPSSLILVTDKLQNTYICSSDNYFVENPFERYVYRSYYSSVYEEDFTKEYCVNYDENGRITDVTIGGENSWYMLGHVYFDRDFSKKFVKILKSEYENSETKENLWEDLYIRYINDLDMFIRKYDKNIIKEFDSLDELREFDEKYINNSVSFIFKNICEVLNCEQKDITEIKPIKSGMTNTSFKFDCKGNSYVYRHPGVGTENYINRKSEFQSMKIAKELGLDDSFIHMDFETGWKISKYIENVEILDYSNKSQVKKAVNMLKRLHKSKNYTEYKFDIFKQIEEFYLKLKCINKYDFNDVDFLFYNVKKLKDILYNDNFSECLCHCDSYDLNFLVDETEKMYLIDWEYSGMTDPAVDLGTFIACSDYSISDAVDIIEMYFDREVTNVELRHYLGYVAICSFYWFLWALYQENNGKNIGEYLYIWHDYTKKYSEYALNM